MPHRGPGRGASFGVIEEPSRADRSPDRLMLVLIATDLDGTLLTGDKRLSSRTVSYTHLTLPTICSV